jgi:hypothetical protein
LIHGLAGGTGAVKRPAAGQLHPNYALRPEKAVLSRR